MILNEATFINVNHDLNPNKKYNKLFNKLGASDEVTNINVMESK